MDTGGEDQEEQTSTLHLLRRTTLSSLSLLPTLLLLSSLLFLFHSLLLNGTLFLSSFIHQDPSLHSLLSKLHLASSSSSSSSSSSLPAPTSPFPPPRRRPLLHLTRLGAVDHDFFHNHRDLSILPYTRPHLPVNATPLYLSDFRSRFAVSGSPVSFKLMEDNVTSDGEDKVRVVDLRFFIAGLEIGRRDVAALLFLVSLVSAAYGWMIFGFVITYSWVLGILFVAVVNDLIRRDVSLTETVISGARLGMKRLSGFVLMRWAVRDTLTQILGLWFFGEVEDQYSFLKLFLRLKLMPFSTGSPWVGVYEREVSGFLVAWFLMDTVLSFVFSVDSWVAVANWRRNGREIVVEGCNLLATMFLPAVLLKFLEVVVCGFLVRWGLAQIGGRSFALMFQLFVEVYFMVAWLMFYFAARSREASSNGRTFGRRELERLVEGLR